MVACDAIAQNRYLETLLCLPQPRQPQLSGLTAFKKMLLVMAPMRDVPNMARQVMSVRARHWMLAD